jgi:hypothetical protein
MLKQRAKARRRFNLISSRFGAPRVKRALTEPPAPFMEAATCAAALCAAIAARKVAPISIKSKVT